MIRRLGPLAALLLLGACAGGTSMGSDLAMVPGKKDNGGCRMYALERGRQQISAVFYQTRGGDFTTDRNEACR